MTIAHTTKIRSSIAHKCTVHNSESYDRINGTNGTCKYGIVEKTMKELKLESSTDKNCHDYFTHIYNNNNKQ